ncbi:uncharacterized protein LOC124846837 [Vigna umbellata]|uniref:uncharacterized protein LOC124846837 n=1 Tax=Vigna umbellata TaxID=87088 RepID=UPI001F5E898A|nr:uncharacterized protein LOC124846837 [Vigna umbellata]
MTTSEEWQCRKFENGLRSDLKVLISSLCIKSFPTMVERAKVLEKNIEEVEQQKKQQQTAKGPISSKSNMNLSINPYARPMPPSTSSGSQSQPLVAASRSGQQGTVTCFQCGGPHYRSSCPKLLGGRFYTRCRRNRHLERECNMGERAVMRPPNAGRNKPRGGGRAQAVGQVYAITGAEAASSGTLITNTCLLYELPCCASF